MNANRRSNSYMPTRKIPLTVKRLVLGTTPAGVTITLADGMVTPAGVVPRTKRFTVSGIFRVGMYEFDRRLAFINIGDAQKLYRMRNTVSGVRLAVTDIYDAPAIVREVALKNGKRVMVGDWTRRHVNFFKSIQIT